MRTVANITTTLKHTTCHKVRTTNYEVHHPPNEDFLVYCETPISMYSTSYAYTEIDSVYFGRDFSHFFHQTKFVIRITFWDFQLLGKHTSTQIAK